MSEVRKPVDDDYTLILAHVQNLQTSKRRVLVAPKHAKIACPKFAQSGGSETRDAPTGVKRRLVNSRNRSGSQQLRSGFLTAKVGGQ